MLSTVLLLLFAGSPKIELATPFAVRAGGKAISVEVGHSAPIITDYDGDGLKDLLVGQFGNGRLRIYKNVGSAAEPKFDKFEWFQAGGKPAEVEAG
jgi:hypothetical protein